MKGEIVQFVFLLLSTVVSAAAEELLPALAGVGFPVLLAFVMVASPRFKVLPGVMAAAGAGAFEGSLASLSPFPAVCLFVIVALLSRREAVPRALLLPLFPLFELWSGLCGGGPRGDVFVRMLVALPLGAVALAVVHPVSAWVAGKAGLDG